MIETPKEIDKRRKLEAKDRASRAEAYAKKMLQPASLITQPIEVAQPLLRNTPTPETELRKHDWPLLRNNSEPKAKSRNKKKDRAEYMRDYRKKPRLCPHCGKDITQPLTKPIGSVD